VYKTFDFDLKVRTALTGRKMAEVLYNNEGGEYVAPLVLEYPNK